MSSLNAFFVWLKGHYSVPSTDHGLFVLLQQDACQCSMRTTQHSASATSFVTVFVLFRRASVNLLCCYAYKLLASVNLLRLPSFSSTTSVRIRKLEPWALPTPSPRNASTQEMRCSCVGYGGTSSAHYLLFSLNLNFSLYNPNPSTTRAPFSLSKRKKGRRACIILLGSIQFRRTPLKVSPW